jgi:hypothetical protein
MPNARRCGVPRGDAVLFVASALQVFELGAEGNGGLANAAGKAHRGFEVDGRLEGFLIVLHERADYASVNFRWFVERYQRFLYIDRIVVARNYQRRGAGQALYVDLLDFARRCKIELLTCEFDIEPLNEASSRFHARYGFKTVGTQVLPDGKKRVALQALTLTAPSSAD